MEFRNSGDALVHKLNQVLAEGRRVPGRGGETLELTHQHVEITSPLDRAAVVHARHGDIFSSIAESLWVFAGRNDMAYLQHYLPRAPLFSDDGVTWRGGYGPRLRDWAGVDQLREVREILTADRMSRRAVVSLFNPATDYADSRDIPCTNWLHADVRDGELNLSVVMRSNDLVWGFSGINSFEWSLLLEMLAYWLEAEPGRLHFYVGSLHLYARHYDRARRIVGGPGVISSPAETPSRFGTPFDELDSQLDSWFAFEEAVRAGATDASALLAAISDPLFRDYALMIAAYWRYTREGRDAGFAALEEVSDDALRFAGASVFRWREGEEPQEDAVLVPDELRAAVFALHRVKDAAYGDSWKRRGERGSILPNIARKVDRFREYSPAAATPGDETWFDTAVDLLVYAVKYRAYLLDQSRPKGVKVWSDGTEGFEELFPELDGRNTDSIERLIERANLALETLESLVDAHAAIDERTAVAMELVTVAQSITLHLAAESPWRTRATLRRWSAWR